MTDFGGGIYLTNDDDLGPKWDIAIDTSGDVKTVRGEDELLKDVSYSTAVRVGPEIGNRLEPVVFKRIKARVKDALEDEPRIRSVLLVEVNEIGTNEVEVVVEANANDEDIELVFEVEL